MTRYDLRTRVFAVCLSALAGFVDATGFLQTDGSFVSFMSGNSTRLAVGTVLHKDFGMVAGALIVCFVLGVVGGSLLGRAAGHWRRTAVLAAMAALLAVAAMLGTSGAVAVALGLTAFVMGAENTIFEADGEVRIGLTYMTGTLVKFGQRIAAAITGGARWGWFPYLALWAGLVGGAVLGAAAYLRFGLAALWFAAAVAAVMAAVSTSRALRGGV